MEFYFVGLLSCILSLLFFNLPPLFWLFMCLVFFLDKQFGSWFWFFQVAYYGIRLMLFWDTF
jgi:hypothetical protein